MLEHRIIYFQRGTLLNKIDSLIDFIFISIPVNIQNKSDITPAKVNVNYSDKWETENDMFADSFSPGIKNNRYRLDQSHIQNPILQDNWTDSEGYFR